MHGGNAGAANAAPAPAAHHVIDSSDRVLGGAVTLSKGSPTTMWSKWRLPDIEAVILNSFLWARFEPYLLPTPHFLVVVLATSTSQPGLPNHCLKTRLSHRRRMHWMALVKLVT